MKVDSNGKGLAEELARARFGDSGALADLLEMYRSYLRFVARKELGVAMRSQLDPSDVVQETLLEAYCDFPKFKGTSRQELAAWLRRILARNLADQFKHHRRLRRDWHRRESLDAHLDSSSFTRGETLVSSLPSPSENAAKEEEALLLAEALAKLSDDHREVIVLRHLERLPFEAIAARLDRTAGAVRKLWVRAMLKLRATLKTTP